MTHQWQHQAINCVMLYCLRYENKLANKIKKENNMFGSGAEFVKDVKKISSV